MTQIRVSVHFSQDAIASALPQQTSGYYASNYAQTRRHLIRESQERQTYEGLELEQVTFPIEPYLPVYRVLLHDKTVGRVTASYLGLWGADGNGGISIDRKYLNCLDAAEALIDAKFCESE